MPASHSKANQRQTKVHKAGYNKYRNEFRRDKNKVRKLKKHLVREPNDRVAARAVETAKKRIGVYT